MLERKRVIALYFQTTQLEACSLKTTKSYGFSDGQFIEVSTLLLFLSYHYSFSSHSKVLNFSNRNAVKKKNTHVMYACQWVKKTRFPVYRYFRLCIFKNGVFWSISQIYQMCNCLTLIYKYAHNGILMISYRTVNNTKYIDIVYHGLNFVRNSRGLRKKNCEQ